MLQTSASTNRKTRKVRLVESSIERVARMLSQQYGIKVVWQPGTCKTDGKVIYLPTLPDDAPDELLEAIQGYLDHETAHILFTDFDATKGMNLSPEQFSCINAVEDVRIENQIGNIFPGSPYNLSKAHEWLWQQLVKNWEQLNQFNRAVTAYFSRERYGEGDIWDKYVDPETRKLVLECAKAVGSYDKISSTKDSIEAGLRMFEVLKEFAEEAKEQREKKEEQSKKNSQGSEGEGQGAGQESATLVQGMGDLGKAVSAVASKVVEAARSGNELKLPGGTNYKHDQQNDSTYLIFDTSIDTFESFPEAKRNAADLQSLRNQTTELVSVMKTKLVNSLRASSQRRWISGKEEGKLDSRRLHRTILGLGDDVFKQRTTKMDINTAVALAIDHSGSMAYDKLRLAGQSAIVVGDALNTLRIPFLVYGYSTHGISPNRISNRDLHRTYARWNGLWIRFYRQFNEPWEAGALKLATAEHNVKENTLDGESVKFGIQQLLARPEKRKILFVFNDGMPYPGYGNTGRGQRYLHDVVAAARKVGVEVVAFGIQDDSVKEYYPNCVVINRLDDLVKEPLQIMDSMLRKGLTLR